MNKSIKIPKNTKYDLITMVRDKTDTKLAKRYRKSQYKKMLDGTMKKYNSEQVFISINQRDHTEADDEIVIMDKKTLFELMLRCSLMEHSEMTKVVVKLQTEGMLVV